jgi:hypothetical protein
MLQVIVTKKWQRLLVFIEDGGQEITPTFGFLKDT